MPMFRFAACGLLAALLAGCGSSSMPAPVMRHPAIFPASEAMPAMHTIGLHEADAPVRLRAGDVLRVRLLASPASGYHWLLESDVPPFLRAETDPGIGPGRAPSMVNVWSFRAEREGHGVLRFAFRRPWDAGTMPIRSLSFPVFVQPH